MKLLPLIALFLHLLKSTISTGSDKLQLELVQVVFRHGDRYPSEIELTLDNQYNPNISTFDEWSFGELTNVGMMRGYTLGKMLRNRYNDFLGDYHSQDVYAQSTSSDRTKVSLQLVLAALYPPTKKSEIWNSELLWRAIPTHYIPGEVDMVLWSTHCPHYVTALKKAQQSPEFQNFVQSHQEEFEWLTNKTGRSIKTPQDVRRYYRLQMMKKSLNLPMPEWLNSHAMEVITKIDEFLYDINYASNNEVKRLAGGPLIRTFIENINKSESIKPSSEKIYLYSAHDTNVAAFTRAHGMKIPRLPNFGSAVILEKLKDPKTGKVYVKFLLWTGVSEELIQVNLTNTTDPCPIDVYLKLVEDIIPTDKEMSCILEVKDGFPQYLKNALESLMVNDREALNQIRKN